MPRGESAICIQCLEDENWDLTRGGGMLQILPLLPERLWMRGDFGCDCGCDCGLDELEDTREDKGGVSRRRDKG